MHRTGIRRAAVACAAALALVSCSSDPGGPSFADHPLEAVVAAMRNSTGAISGSIETAEGTTDFAGSWSGDLATGQGFVRGTIQHAAGPVDIDFRWSGGVVYLRRSAEGTDVTTSPLGQLLLKSATAAPWLSASTPSSIDAVVALFSPADFVARLDLAGIVDPTEGPDIDGASTQRHRRTLNGWLFDWVGPHTGEVLVDQDDRVLRARVEAGDVTVDYEVSYATGGPPAVELPSAEELVTPTTQPAKPDDEFVTIRDGVGQGVSWTLSSAPSTSGGVCWRWESTPALEVIAPNVGAATRCYPPAENIYDPLETVDAVVVATSAELDLTASAFVLPELGWDVTLGYVDGRRDRRRIETAVFVEVGTLTSALTFVEFARDGQSVSCGVGAVLTIGDASDDQLVRDVTRPLWSCIPGL